MNIRIQYSIHLRALLYAVVILCSFSVQAQFKGGNDDGHAGVLAPSLLLGAPPTISGFTPLSGPIGTTVTITGTNYDATPTNNIVYFGATQATVTSATSTELTVTVPTGATYQPITVQVGGLTAYSSKPFVVTFPDGGTIDACSFAPKVDFTTGSIPRGVVIGDLDGDGKADLALVNGSSATLSTYLNTSTAGDINAGSFATPVDFATDTSPRSLALGDVNGDGKLDLVCVQWPSFSVFENTSTPGTISFNRLDFTTDILQYAARAAIGDLDGDGKPEIVIPNNLTEVSVFKNLSTSGAISFAPKVDYPVYGSIESPYSVAIGDLDNDNKPDLVISLIGTASSISVLRNTGTTGVIDVNSFAPFVDFGPDLNPVDFAIADLDGDLKLDLAIANIDDNSVSILRNISSPGTLDATSFAPRVDFVMGPLPNNIVINDLDGDGKPDLAIARRLSTVLSVFKNTSTPGVIDASSFDPPDNFSSGPVVSFLYGIASGDLDGDGTPDLVITNDKISILRNTVVKPLPTITSFSPSSGVVGSTVTISGTNFSTTANNNIVMFNGVAATVTASTTTSITTSVPSTATSGFITVTVGCNTATSSSIFIVDSCVPITQRDALIELYNRTNGSSWTDNDNWLNADVGTWYGVMVTGCNVTELNLGENHLEGYLPSEIGDLTDLITLNLSDNNLYYGLPSELGNLTNLQSLSLGANQFEGDIPIELVNLSSLVEVSLSNNRLSGVVPAIGLASMSMSHVNLEGNSFYGLDDITGYYNLNSFSIGDNNLTFEDLEPNASVSNFSYSPQAKLPPGGLVSFTVGGSLSIPFTTPGTANSYQWYKDGVLIPGATSATLFIASTVIGDEGTYYVEVSNSIATGVTLQSHDYLVIADPCTSAIRTTGFLDATFHPDFDSPASVYGIAIQSTGKIIAVAPTTTVGGVPVNGTIRFNADGTFDNTFNQIPEYTIPLIQPVDNKILGYAYDQVIRFDADGLEDTDFNSNAPQSYSSSLYAMALQPDGKIVYSIDSYMGSHELSRLNSDGNPDSSFPSISLLASALEVQADGKILVGEYSGSLSRLNTDGTTDFSFNAGPDLYSISDMVVQPDGKIIVIGGFTSVQGSNRFGIARLNTDGSLDASFVAQGISELATLYAPYRVALMSNGQLIVVGNFTTVNGSQKKNLVRLNSDGTVDCSFDPGLGTDEPISGLALQSNGEILISGDFDDYDGTSRYSLARITNGAAPASCVPASERAALVALYTSTNGASWTNNTGWLSADESTWFGVSVNGCTIDEIKLENNNLSGSLPTEVGDLPSLMHLFLKDNNLTGTLPVELSNLSNMDFLDLASNNITGSIPQEIGSLNNLFYLDFSGNQLSGSIPVEFGNLSSLGYLELDQNQLTGTIPSELGNISTLLSIDLGRNLLTGSIPPSLGNLSNLAFIDFESNQLTGPIPTELGNTSLAFLRLNHNQLSGTIPVSLGNLTDLFLLEIIQNQLTGSIPEELGNLPLLQYLKLSENQLTGSIPPELGNLGALEFLELYSNQLTGIIPPQLGDAASLRFLILGRNQLTGSIPISLGTLIDLFQLDLSENQLTGSIPPELGNNASLTNLFLHVNQLSGPIPKELGNLVNLEILDIFTNQLSGSLPIELAQCIQLRDFEVAENQLSGTLPIEYASFTNLRVFQIGYNNFTGSVPIEYLAWNNVQELLLSDNQLDAIPTFTAGSITILEVQNNNLEFGDLESNIGTTGYVYAPQKNLPGGTASICEGTTLTIPFSTTGTLNSYQWYKDGVLISGATSAPYSKSNATPSDAGNYSVQINNSIVTGLTLQSDNFAVTINATSGSPTTTGASSCGPSAITLTASGGTNGQYRWYSVATGGTAITGEVNSSYTTPSLTSTATYFVAINDGTCESTRTSVIAQIDTPPSPTSSGGSSCETSSVIVNASGGTNGEYRWYNVATGGSAIAGEVNSSYTTPSISTTTTYYVSINNGTCESTRTSVIAQIDTPPSAPTTTSGSSCGASAVIVNASGATNGEYRWYDLASGGTAIAGEVNSSYTTPSISTTTTYFVSINNGTCESTRTSVIAQIDTPPAAPTTTGASNCGASTLTLNAIGGVNGEYRWYSVATGGTAIAGEVNSSYTTPSISTTTTYYVSINNGICESARASVVAQINTPPAAPTTTGASNCGASTLTLNATGGVNGEYRWYDVASGGTAIAGEVNSSYTTPSISSTTPYYVAINNGTCESLRSAAVATINTIPSKPLITSSGSTTLCSGQSVTLSAPVGFTYSWSTGAISQQIIVNTSGSFTVQITSAGCTSAASDPVVVSVDACNQPPAIANASVEAEVGGSVSLPITDLLSDPDNNLDLSTLRIVQQPTSGASASINSNELIINYQGFSFVGTDELTIEVCDLDGECTQQVITIEVIGDIIVYNAISPNTDNKNPALILKYIEAIEETQKNKVSIFNRWGDLVWEGVNYNNTSVVFNGLNKNGNELPTGTYFYKIEFTSGRKTDSGYLSLKR